MLRTRSVSLGTVVWIVVGMIAAANHHFLDHLDSVSRIGSAILAVVLWPLVLLHIHIGI